jgi:hypothetical protein
MEKQQDLGKSPEQSKSNLFHIAYTDALAHGATVPEALEAAIAMNTWAMSIGKLDPNADSTLPLPDKDPDPQS